jgi:hypothetical protein
MARKKHKQNANQKQTTNFCAASKHTITNTKMYTKIMEADLFLYSLEINSVPKVQSLIYQCSIYA